MRQEGHQTDSVFPTRCYSSLWFCSCKAKQHFKSMGNSGSKQQEPLNLPPHLHQQKPTKLQFAKRLHTVDILTFVGILGYIAYVVYSEGVRIDYEKPGRIRYTVDNPPPNSYGRSLEEHVESLKSMLVGVSEEGAKNK